MKPCPLCGSQAQKPTSNRPGEIVSCIADGCSFYCRADCWDALPRRGEITLALGPPERFVPTSFAGEFELDDKEE